ncbi:hypothetical protein W03_04300 [Nitrosomonas sp. PY1]|nr:hypothetical protein W03_04300 [Nitrosomonas sp. PY1]
MASARTHSEACTRRDRFMYEIPIKVTKPTPSIAEKLKYDIDNSGTPCIPKAID